MRNSRTVKFGSHVETRRKTRARESSRRGLAGLRVRISLRPTQLRVRRSLAGRSGNTIVVVPYAVPSRVGYGLQMT
jgi:hypothetical protein